LELIGPHRQEPVSIKKTLILFSVNKGFKLISLRCFDEKMPKKFFKTISGHISVIILPCIQEGNHFSVVLLQICQIV
jgi:hypothetical protein